MAIVLSLLRYTDSDYPFVIFKLFLNITSGSIIYKYISNKGENPASNHKYVHYFSICIHSMLLYKALFLDLYLEFEDSGQLSTKIYDKRDDFNFKIINFQTCAAIYQLLLHMVFTSRNWFAMQGPVAIILISWNVIFIWETGYWTRAIKRFALFDILKILYSDTKILSKYIPSLQKRL